MRCTIAFLLFTCLSVWLLISTHVAALPIRDSESHEPQGCVRWKLVSYIVTSVTSPTGSMFEYYVTFTDGRGDYQALSLLSSQSLSATELASYAPVTCP
jgi:hypothetical protein